MKNHSTPRCKKHTISLLFDVVMIQLRSFVVVRHAELECARHFANQLDKHNQKPHHDQNNHIELYILHIEITKGRD
jgi:hypothetical protein